MDQRISIITLAVHDLAESRRFSRDGLGWSAELDVPSDGCRCEIAVGPGPIGELVLPDDGGS